jgi:Na+/H+ antiporter
LEHSLDVGLAAFGLLVGATAVAGLARRLRVSAPVLLVVVGLAVSFIPGVPDYTLNPDVVLLLILPPLLYSAALESSYIGFRANLRPIGFLSIGLVLATTVVVGFVVHAAIPQIPLAAAFALGAIVAPPDAVAAAAVGRELGLPRRVLTILGGESLVNDATALTALRVATAAAVGGGISLLEGTGMFVLAAGGGVVVGLVLAPALHWLRRRITEPVLENTLSLVTPFAAYLAAESIDASGVLAVVVVGLYLGHHEAHTSYAARLQASAVWRMIDFLLESIVFALIGLQLPAVLGALDGKSAVTYAGYAVLVTVVVIVVRVVWVFPFTYGPRWLSKRIRERDPSPPWQVPAVISWAGMRGVVSLAAAFALAPDFPARELILFLTFAVVLGTLVIQGFTLPWVIRKLGIEADETYRDNLAEANAQHRAINAAIDRLDELMDGESPPPDDVVERLRAMAEHRRNGAWERLGGGTGQNNAETPSSAFRRLRREMLGAERQAFLEMRNKGHLDDEVMRQVMYELDLEEAMLDWRSAR